MHQVYGYSSDGRSGFLKNRFLRIYPQYWLAIFVSVLVVVVVGHDIATDYHHRIYLPTSVLDWTKNISLGFLHWRPVEVEPMLVPAAWALTVELFFYMLICLGISRTLSRVKVWFVCSVAYVLTTYFLNWPWEDRYFPLAAGSLPFSIGAGIFFLASTSNRIAPSDLMTRKLFALFVLNAAFWCLLRMRGNHEFADFGFYSNLLICSLLIYFIARGGIMSNRLMKWDANIGRFSYPIYLVHWQIGLMMSWIIWGEAFSEPTARGFLNLVISGFVIIPICWISLRFIDSPVQKIRNAIKQNLNSQS